MILTYKLDGTTPVPCQMSEVEIGTPVSGTRVGDSLVSTSFLGIDHNFSDHGAPVLFETLVIGGSADGEQLRYRTWAEALAGHAQMVAHVKSLEKIWVNGEEV